MHKLKCYEIPDGSKASRGFHFANLLQLQEGERISAMFRTKDFDDDKLLGKICIASSLMFYCFPIYTIIRVIREKNAKLIHIYNISIYFLGVMCWFVYGIIDKDYFIAFPYLLGGLIALTQIILYRIYRLLLMELGSIIYLI